MPLPLKNAHIFRTGTWNEIPFTEDDLDKIVSSFERLKLDGRVPLKFGHNPDQPITDGQPALGWVERIWRSGSELLADFKDVPTTIFEALKKGLYKFVSVEMLRDMVQDGVTYPFVLDAVALLGADKPAVGNLRDLQALTLSRTSGVSFGEKVVFTTADPKKVIKESRRIMDEETMKATIADLEKQNKVLLTRAETAETEGKKLKIEGHREKLVAVFERGVKAQAITPGQRDTMLNVLGITDDERVLNVKVEDCEKLIGPAKKGGDETQRTSFSRKSGGDDDGNDEDYEDPSAELVRRAEEAQQVNPKLSFTEAKRLVFRRDPELGKKYIFQMDGR